MPEEYPNRNNTINKKSTKKADETKDLENRQNSKIQKMLHVVQNFFNNVPTKGFNEEFKDGKNNRKTPDDAVMRRNARNSPHKDLSRGKENKNPQRNLNDNCGHRYCLDHKQRANNQLLQNANHTFGKLQLNGSRLEEELKNRADDKNNTETNEIKALLHKENGSESVINIKEDNIAGNKRKSAESKLACSRRHPLEISSAKMRHRYSEPTNQRSSSSSHTNRRPDSDDLSLNRRTLFEENMEAVVKLHLRPRSVILLSENDINTTFTAFKPDVHISVHQTSKIECNFALMSGGEVGLEGFANVFKLPNYYADNPIVSDDTSKDMTKPSSPEEIVSETLVTEYFFSGGKVADNSSKGVSLPELFPLKPLKGPSLQRLLSGDFSFSSGSEVSLDILSNILSDQDSNSSSDSVFLSERSDSDVPSMSADVAKNGMRMRS